MTAIIGANRHTVFVGVIGHQVVFGNLTRKVHNCPNSLIVYAYLPIKVLCKIKHTCYDCCARRLIKGFPDNDPHNQHVYLHRTHTIATHLLCGGRVMANLTYSYSKYPTSQMDSTEKSMFVKALDTWSKLANVQFTYTDDADTANIVVGFSKLGTAYLGMTNSSDGQKLVSLEDPSEVPINSSYDYVSNGNSIPLQDVMTHEVGHALNLSHTSGDTYSVMAASGLHGNNGIPDLTDAHNIQAFYGKASQDEIYVQDNSTGVDAYLPGDSYSGPLTGLIDEQLIIGATTNEDTINITSDMLNITSTGSANRFIHSGSNKDYIDVSASTGSLNIMDAGGESNFLMGSKTARNVSYVDDRSTVQTDVWSTLANGHSGDDFIVWGISDADFKTYNATWADNQGAGGYTGLTFHLSKDGGEHYASATLAGYTTSDLATGRVSYSFGVTNDSNYYMDIKIS